MIFKKLFPILFSAVSLTSCATIINTPEQNLTISSCPSDANIWVDSYYVGRTPTIVNLTRRHNHYVRIELEGYEPFETVLQKGVSGWVFGNIALGGIIGIACDAATGSMYKLTPDQLHAHMTSNSMLYSKKTADAHISIVNEVDPSWEKIGSMTPQN